MWPHRIPISCVQAEIEGIKRDHPEELAYITMLAERMQECGIKGELALLLAAEVADFSMFELQVIGGRLAREIDRLPSPYREKVRPHLQEQIFGLHHRLIAMHREGRFASMADPIRNMETYRSFCTMLPVGCFCWEQGRDHYPHLEGPRNQLFYYLVSAFAMFVLDLPGHPVGTPFPGGFTVEKREGDYYCPIRDREEEVPYSICNFCPARQGDVP